MRNLQGQVKAIGDLITKIMNEGIDVEYYEVSPIASALDSVEETLYKMAVKGYEKALNEASNDLIATIKNTLTAFEKRNTNKNDVDIEEIVNLINNFRGMIVELNEF